MADFFICHQLAFLQSHKTNLRLTSCLPYRELYELTDRINEMIDLFRKIKQDSQQSETHLKETLANLSHDIHIPLTSLDGYFQLFLQSESKEERQRYSTIIQTRINSLKGMLEELFTYTKLQDSAYQLATERIDFGKCVYDTVFSFYDANSGVEPHMEFCDGYLWVNGNQKAVRRTVQNLIKNALVHGNTQIALELFQENKRVGVRCSNDVEHPEEIDVQRVFSRFYKADILQGHIPPPVWDFPSPRD